MSRRQARAQNGSDPRDAISTDPVWFAAQLVLFADLLVRLLAMDPYAQDTFVLPKSALGHGFTLGLVALLIPVVARHGAPVLRASWIHVGAAAVFLAFAIATPFALDQTVALFGTSRRFLGLTNAADNLALYAGAAILIRTPADAVRLLSALCAGLVPVIAYGFVQRLGLDPIKFTDSTLHPISTLGQPDVLAGLLSIVIPTLTAVLVVCWQPMRRSSRLALGAVIAGSAAVMLFTEVRNAVLGVGAGMSAFVIIAAMGWPLRRWVSTPKRRNIVAGGVVLMLGALLLSPLGGRLRPDVLAADPAIEARLDGWRGAIGITADHPLFGIGPDNFVVAYPAVRTELSVIATSNETLNSTHSWFFNVLVSTGIAGTVAMLALLVLIARSVLRLARHRSLFAFAAVPIAAYLGQGLVDVNDVGLEWIFWIAAGVVAAVDGPPLRQPTRLRRSGFGTEVVVAAVLIAAAALFGSSTLNRVRASEALKAADAYAVSDRPLAAVDAARQAIALDGRRGEYWNGFGSALASAGNASAAYNAFIDGTQRAPWMPALWRNAALAKVRLGDPVGALDAAKRALRADRLDVETLNIVARLSFNLDQYDAALEPALTAVRLRPDDSSLYVVPALTYEKLGRPADAEVLLRSGLATVDRAELHVLLAELLASDGRIKEAIDEVNAALVLDPTNPAIQSLKDGLVGK